jgi:hypothetical protein
MMSRKDRWVWHSSSMRVESWRIDSWPLTPISRWRISCLTPVTGLKGWSIKELQSAIHNQIGWKTVHIQMLWTKPSTRVSKPPQPFQFHLPGSGHSCSSTALHRYVNCTALHIYITHTWGQYLDIATRASVFIFVNSIAKDLHIDFETSTWIIVCPIQHWWPKRFRAERLR